ncbi:MAG: hypothetical protein ACLUGF_07640 [Clostridium sp.]
MMEDKGAFVFPLCEMKVVCTDGAEKLLDELSQIKNMTGLFSQARMRFIYFC